MIEPLAALSVSIDELAAALQRSAGYLKRNYHRLVSEHGMPRTIAGGNWCWPRGLVSDWIASGGIRRPARPGNDNQPEDDGSKALIDAQNRSLAERYSR